MRLVAMLALGGVIACSSSSASSTPAPPGSTGGVDPVTGPADASTTPPTFAAAVGDPCRGLPLPIDQIYLPAGMCASVVALNVAGLRQLTFLPNGDLLGANDGRIFLFRDDDGDGAYAAGEVHTWAKTRASTNNGHLDVTTGYVYAGTDDGVSRFAYDPASLTGGAEEKVVTG